MLLPATGRRARLTPRFDLHFVVDLTGSSPREPANSGNRAFRPDSLKPEHTGWPRVEGFALKEQESVNRKLIRPSLSEIQEQMSTGRMQRRKPTPPDQTNAESFYYVKQMQARTPMVVVLDTGETIRGVIEWYDKNCIKVHRTAEPNLLIFKSAIRYIYKQNDSKNGNNGEDVARDAENE